MSYSIKNLREVADSAVRFGFSETQESRFARDDLDAEDTGISYHVVKPNQRQPFGHRHERAEEIYVVIAGSGRIKLDDQVEEIRTLDAIRIAPAVLRSLEAGPDGLEVIAVGPHHEGEAELVQDVWT
jgi:mannose-6-phosphate isomerase-like protein (cupin superfamily)